MRELETRVKELEKNCKNLKKFISDLKKYEILGLPDFLKEFLLSDKVYIKNNKKMIDEFINKFKGSTNTDDIADKEIIYDKEDNKIEEMDEDQIYEDMLKIKDRNIRVQKMKDFLKEVENVHIKINILVHLLSIFTKEREISNIYETFLDILSYCENQKAKHIIDTNLDFYLDLFKNDTDKKINYMTALEREVFVCYLYIYNNTTDFKNIKRDLYILCVILNHEIKKEEFFKSFINDFKRFGSNMFALKSNDEIFETFRAFYLIHNYDIEGCYNIINGMIPEFQDKKILEKDYLRRVKAEVQMKKSVDAVSTAQVTRSLSVKLQDCIIWRNLRGGDKNNHGRNKGQSKESELYSVNICEKVKMTRIINNLNDLTSRHSEVLGNTEGRITYISEEKFYIRTKFYIRMKRVNLRCTYKLNHRRVKGIKQKWYWPGMKDYIKVLKMGEMCLINNRKVKKGIEFATTDRMSEEEASSKNIIRAMEMWLSKDGVTEEIISDNAKVFSSEEIRKWIIIMRSYSSNGSQARRL
ncbi:hypothetical protein P3W45_000710 [Vairimorpha bombi]